MKALLHWFAKIIGSTFTIILVIVLFPYVSRFAASILPDASGAAIKTSAILSTKLENSARLETIHVAENGVLNNDITAMFIGSVANINVSYVYEASIGIDLSKVSMQVFGNRIVFNLPQPEILHDSITPVEVYRDDFWLPGFSDKDYQKLLEDERLSRRNAYLCEEKSTRVWDASIKAFEQTIASWIKDIKGSATFEYVQASTIQ